MSHPFAYMPAKASGGEIQNGSLVVLVREPASNIQKRAPDLNSVNESSGVLNVRTSGRFVDPYQVNPPVSP